MVRYSFLIVFIILTTFSAWSQNRYVVHLTDKANNPYSISNPSEFLSQKAIDRRTKQGIAITEEDLPVNPVYIDELKALGIEVYYSSKWFNAVLVQMQAADVSEVTNLSFVSDVELVAPGARLKLGSRNGRTEDGEDTEAISNSFQNSILGIDVLHDLDYFGEGLTIAVLDGGFPGITSQPAFEHLITDNKILDQFNFIENDDVITQYGDHGTRALSAIAANLENEYSGIAPNADYLLYITEEERNVNGSFTEYRVEEYNLLFAAEKADSAGVDIISTSLGYYTFDNSAMSYTYEDMDGETTVVTRACEKAFEKGIFVVTSAGNQGNKSWKYITAPADGPNVMSVGAVDANLERENFSSFGPNFNGHIKPDVMALGVGTSLIDQEGSTTSSGTSFSAPLVAGLAALLWQKEPELTNRELFDLILSLGNQSDNPNNEYGYGVPNAAKLVTSVQESLEDMSVWPNPFNSFLKITNHSNVVDIQLLNINGKTMAIAAEENANEIAINTSHLLPGFYILRIRNNDGAVRSRKLIKSIE